MERWNEEQNEKNTYTLLEVFDEVWNDKRKADMAMNQEGKSLENLDSDQLDKDGCSDDEIRDDGSINDFFQ